MKYSYLQMVLIALDQLANAILCGSCDETLSARCYREKRHLRYVIDTLFFWQKNHCKMAYESEILRKQLPEEYQK